MGARLETPMARGALRSLAALRPCAMDRLNRFRREMVPGFVPECTPFNGETRGAIVMEEQEVNVSSTWKRSSAKRAHRASWAEKVALTTALLAVFAAGSNLASTYQSIRRFSFASRLLTGGLITRPRVSRKWSHWSPRRRRGTNRNKRQSARKHNSLSHRSHHAHHVHEFFAYAVTLFQVATAVGAIAVLVKRKYFWYSSIMLGLAGIVLITKAFALLRS